MTDWTEPVRCALCGHTDKRDLAFRLVHWKVSDPGMAYQHVPRCRDDAACRSRVELAKRIWPLVETPRKDVA